MAMFIKALVLYLDMAISIIAFDQTPRQIRETIEIETILVEDVLVEETIQVSSLFAKNAMYIMEEEIKVYFLQRYLI